MAAFAGVLLVVGRYATLKATLLAVWGSKANAFGRNGTGGGFALSFGTEFFGHDAEVPVSCEKP